MATAIKDGFTREDVIPATRRHPEARIIYRPATGAERRKLLAMNGQLAAEGAKGIDKSIAASLKLVAEHIVSWDLEDPDKPGEVLPINADMLGALEPNLFEAINSAVLGYDDRPLDDAEKQILAAQTAEAKQLKN